MQAADARWPAETGKNIVERACTRGGGGVTPISCHFTLPTACASVFDAATAGFLHMCRTLVGEGHVDALRVYGADGNTAIVTLKDSAPGGARQCKVRPIPPCLAYPATHDMFQ